MKKSWLSKVKGLTFVMLLLLSLSVAPVMAVDGGSSSGSCSVNTSVSKPVITDLNAKDESVYFEKAALNQNVQKLDAGLLKEGYKKQEKKAFKVQVTEKDGSLTNIYAVVTVYGKNETDQKSILFMNNEKTGVSSTIMLKGNALQGNLTLCIIAGAACALGCTVCAAACVSEAIVDDDGYLCTACGLLNCTLPCAAAICTCSAACCEAGNQWCCDHRCP